MQSPSSLHAPNAKYETRKSLGVRAYDLFNERADKDGVVRGDLDFYVSCAREFGGPVLEPATGTGRVLLPLALAGFEITGVDISAATLDQARRKIGRELPAVREKSAYAGWTWLRLNSASVFG